MRRITEASGRAFLPVAVVDELRGAGPVTVTAADGSLVVTAGDRTIRVPAEADGFPDWRRLEPVDPPHRVVVDGPAFRAAVSSGAARRQDHAGVGYDAIVLTLDGGELTVGGAGDTLAVGVNRDYLLDALGTHDQLVLELDGPITPLAIRRPGHADWSLLMPVNLAG